MTLFMMRYTAVLKDTSSVFNVLIDVLFIPGEYSEYSEYLPDGVPLVNSVEQLALLDQA